MIFKTEHPDFPLRFFKRGIASDFVHSLLPRPCYPTRQQLLRTPLKIDFAKILAYKLVANRSSGRGTECRNACYALDPEQTQSPSIAFPSGEAISTPKTILPEKPTSLLSNT